MKHIGVLMYIDDKGLSVDDIKNNAFRIADDKYTDYHISEVTVRPRVISTRDGDMYEVDVYGMEVLNYTPKIGDTVINDLDGKEYTITAVATRKSESGGPVLIGHNVYLCDGTGNTATVYSWEVTPVNTKALA